MKNWKICSLLAVLVMMVGTLSSCKDEKEVVVEQYGLYKAAVQSITGMDKTVKKAMCDSLKIDVTAYLTAIQVNDTNMMTSAKTITRFNEIVEQVANQFKNGSDWIPDGKYAEVALAMQCGSAVARQGLVRIYGEKSEIVYETISVIPSTAYELGMPYVLNENVDESELSFITDSIYEEVLPREWPKYGISKEKAIELYDAAIAEQVKDCAAYSFLCPEDTMSLTFGFALLYNDDSVIKTNEILVNNKGAKLIK